MSPTALADTFSYSVPSELSAPDVPYWRLAELAERPEPHIQAALISHLAARLPSCSAEGRERLGQLLPKRLEGLPGPGCVALARAYRELPPGVPLPPVSFEDLPFAARHEWARTHSCRCPNFDLPPGLSAESLLRGYPWSKAYYPVELVERFVNSSSPQVRELLVTGIGLGLERGWLKPARARVLLEELKTRGCRRAEAMLGEPCLGSDSSDPIEPVLDIEELWHRSLTVGQSPEKLAAQLLGRWPAWLERLANLPLEHQSWPLQIELLERAETRESRQFLLGLLEPQSPDLSQIVRSLGKLGIEEAESRLLELSDRSPEDFVFALSRVGGERTRQRLLQAPPSQWTPEQVWSVLKAVGPPTEESVEDWNLEQLRSGRPRQQLPALDVLGEETGTLADIPVLESLLAEGDTEILEAVCRAVLRVGERVYGRGQRNRLWLHRAEEKQEAGRFLVAETLMRAIQGDLSLARRLELLERLSTLHHPRLAEFLVAWREHTDPEIRRWVLVCYQQPEIPLEADWLWARLSTDDPKDLRWALEVLKCRPELRPPSGLAHLLEHPNMNIKKLAASLMGKCGTVVDVPLLLDWLCWHENPGFHAELQGALKSLLDGKDICVLLQAIERKDDPRRRRLLLSALDQRLDEVTWEILGRSPLGPVMRDMQRKGDLSLRGQRIRPALEELSPWEFLDRLERAQRLELAVSLAKLGVQLRAMDTSLRTLFIAPLRRLLKAHPDEQEALLECLAVCGAVPTEAEARLGWRSDSDQVRAWVLPTLMGANRLSLTEVCDALVSASWSFYHIRPRLISYAVSRGWLSELLRWFCLKDSCWGIQELRRSWTSEHCTAPPVDEILGVWKVAEGACRVELFDWVAEGDESTVESLAVEMLEERSGFRWRASSLLRDRWTPAAQKAVEGVLVGGSAQARQSAARVLLDWGGVENRRRVIEALLRDRLEPMALRLVLTEREVRFVMGARHGPLRRWEIDIITNSKASMETRLEALLKLRETPVKEENCRLEFALRGIPHSLMWERIQPDLAEERWDLVDYLGGSPKVPAAIVERLHRGNSVEVKVWLKWLARSGDKLEGERLEQALEKHLSGTACWQLALRLYGRLQCWNKESEIQRARLTLEPLIDDPKKGALAREVLLSIGRRLPRRARVALLVGLGHEKAIGELTEICLEEGEVGSECREILYGRLRSLCRARCAGKASQAVKLMMREWPDHATDLLKEALDHRDIKLRLFAHRRLKRLLPRAEFLDLTVRFLGERNPELRKMAIKTLCFARHGGAIPRIVPLLWDRKKRVDRVARRSLIFVGEDALPYLRKAMAQCRPDRRPLVDQVIQAIQASEEG